MFRQSNGSRSNPCWGILALAGALCSHVYALDPGRAIGQYVYDVWQPKQGLPHPYARCLAQTMEGYLWIGTPVGLVRFDGFRFTLFDSANTPALTHPVVSLMTARDGVLWIGMYGGGVASYTDGQFRTHPQTGAGQIWAMRETSDGSIWVAANSQILRRRQGEWLRYGAAEGLPGATVHAIYETRDGTVWAGTHGKGLLAMRAGRFVPVPGLTNQNVRSLWQDGKGTLWVGLEGGGVVTLQEERVTCPPGLEFLRFDSVRALTQDRDGNVWIGTDTYGLVRWNAGQVSSFQESNGFADNGVWALLEDQEANLWVGTRSGGVAKLTDGKFVTLSRHEETPDDVWSVLEDSRGTVWMGSAGKGLLAYTNGVFRVYTRRDGLPDNYIRALFEDSHGTLWIGTANGDVATFRKGLFHIVRHSSGTMHIGVRAFAETADGSVWFGTLGEGLMHYRNGRLLPFSQMDRLPGNSLSALFTDREGRLWMGFYGHGVAVWNGETVTTFGAAQGLTYPTVWSFLQSRDGDLWLTTNGGGLFRFRKGRFDRFTESNGLPSKAFSQVLEDERENLWLGSERGVFRVAKEEFEKASRNPQHRIESTAFDATDGLKSVECNGGSQPAAHRTREGVLLFATTRGAVAIDPKRIRSNSRAPSVVLESVTANGRQLAGSSLLELKAGARNIEIQYTGVSLQAPQKVRFRYKLEGYDPDWTDSGPRRTAYYSQLPPGHYKFRVAAANNDGIWNLDGASLALVQKPFFYQTSGFISIAVLALTIASWLLYRLRLRRIEKGFAAVLAERGRIAREMHDTVIQGSLGAATLLEAAASVLPASTEAAAKLLDQAREQFRRCMDEARFYVLNLRTPESERISLPSSLTRLAADVESRYGAHVSLSVDGAYDDLTAQQSYHLLRIAQEALFNAARHSGSETIFVRLDGAAKALRLTIKDQGMGFAQQAARQGGEPHFGLLGMRERAGQIGGELTVRSAPGEGTEVAVRLGG